MNNLHENFSHTKWRRRAPPSGGSTTSHRTAQTVVDSKNISSFLLHSTVLPQMSQTGRRENIRRQRCKQSKSGFLPSVGSAQSNVVRTLFKKVQKTNVHLTMHSMYTGYFLLVQDQHVGSQVLRYLSVQVLEYLSPNLSAGRLVFDAVPQGTQRRGLSYGPQSVQSLVCQVRFDETEYKEYIADISGTTTHCSCWFLWHQFSRDRLSRTQSSLI